MQRMRHRRSLRSWFGAVVLSVSAFCIGVALADAPARHYQALYLYSALLQKDCL